MKRYFIITGLLITTGMLFGQIPADSIKAIIKQEVASKRSKSIIVGIVDAHGRQIFSEGILSDENPIPPDSNTIYEIGSITKVFTSLVLAEMSVKKQLDLYDPVSKYLPKTVKAPTKNGKEISLINLSTHRASFPRNAYNIDPKNLDDPFADYTETDLYAYLSAIELQYDIDSKWAYSNIGYALLGNLLTIVAKKDFESLVKQEICDPLKMNNTVITLTPELRKNIAQGYTEYGKPAHEWDLPLAGGGGYRSNMNDMLTFAAANLGLVKTDLLPAMELSHVKQAEREGNSYMAMGWTLWDQEKQLLYKDGGTGGYRTFLGIDKKNKIGVVVLTNTNNLATDIGMHILDSSYHIQHYHYRWNLLDTLRSIIQSKGVDAGIELYQQLKAANDPNFNFNESQLNHLGNELRRDKKIKEAIKIYELNIKEYPKSAMVYESLGETYRRNNDKKLAIPCFEKAMELDPKNPHWAFILNKIKSN